MATGTIKSNHLFIDTSNILHTLSSLNEAWTATADCWALGSMWSTASATAGISIDNVDVIYGAGASSVANASFPVSLPVKKGQTIKTRNAQATGYAINLFAMK